MAPSIRLINLVEVLKEQLEDSGKQLPADLTDDQLQDMTEAEVRRYYQQHTQPVAVLQPLAAHADPPRGVLSPVQQLQALHSKFPSLDDTPTFKAWFPAFFTSRGQQLRPAQPTAVVLCFHSSGNAEDMFTSEGTGSRWAWPGWQCSAAEYMPSHAMPSWYSGWQPGKNGSAVLSQIMN